MTPTLIVFLWLVVIAGKAVIDNYQIKRKIHIYHGMELIAVIIVAIFHAALSGVRKADWYAIDMLIFQASSFWLLFDGILSALRGKPLLYVGKTSATDKFFWRVGLSFYPWTKVIAGIFVVYSTVQIYKYWL